MHALYSIGIEEAERESGWCTYAVLLIIPAPLSHSLRRSTLPKKTGKERRRKYFRDRTEEG